MTNLVTIENIENKILVLKGQKVLLDRDLAELYGVATSNLNKAVTRNIERFPDDFMFKITKEESDNLIFQIGTSRWGGTRKLPRVFTEQGVAMLSGILKSKRAINVNIAIMRAFVRMRKIVKSNELTKLRLDDIEDRLGTQEFQTLAIFDQLGTIKKKLKPAKAKDKTLIGFSADKK